MDLIQTWYGERYYCNLQFDYVRKLTLKTLHTSLWTKYVSMANMDRLIIFSSCLCVCMCAMLVFAMIQHVRCCRCLLVCGIVLWRGIYCCRISFTLGLCMFTEFDQLHLTRKPHPRAAKRDWATGESVDLWHLSQSPRAPARRLGHLLDSRGDAFQLSCEITLIYVTGFQWLTV